VDATLLVEVKRQPRSARSNDVVEETATHRNAAGSLQARGVVGPSKVPFWPFPVEEPMARSKHIESNLRFLPADLARQLLPGTCEHALQHLIGHAIDLSTFDARCGSSIASSTISSSSPITGTRRRTFPPPPTRRTERASPAGPIDGSATLPPPDSSQTSFPTTSTACLRSRQLQMRVRPQHP